MANTVEIKIKVDADTKDIHLTSEELERLKTKAKESEEGISALSLSFGKIAAAGAAITGVSLSFETIAEGIKKSVSAAAEFETFEATLKTLTGSSVEAKKAMAWIEEFAAKTPYELGEVTASFIKLKSYGIDPIKGDTLKVLGDTASAIGKTLDQAVEALADAMTGEFERLKEFGIKASVEGENVTFKWADASGKLKQITVKNNAEMVEDTLKAIWNEKYQDAMEERAKTFEGIASNMKDNITKALRTFAEESGLFDSIKEGLQEVSKLVGSITREDMQEFGNALRAVGEIAKTAFEIFAIFKAGSWLIAGITAVASGFVAIAREIRAAGAAMAAFNLLTRANPLLLAIGAATAAYALFGSSAEEAEKKAAAAIQKTAEVTKEKGNIAEQVGKKSIGISQEEGRAAEEAAKATKEFVAKYKSYNEERQKSHEKTIESLKQKELDLKAAILRANAELHEKLKQLEKDRVEAQRGLTNDIREIQRKLMSESAAYYDKQRQAAEELSLARRALAEGDLRAYEKHRNAYLALVKSTAGEEIRENGKVVISKEETARAAIRAINAIRAEEDRYYALKAKAEREAHNHKIALLQAELKATQAKIQAEIAQLEILKKIYEAISGKTISIDVNTESGKAAIRELDAQYKALEKSKIKIDADASAAKREIENAKAGVGGATMRINADGTPARDEAQKVKSDLERAGIVIQLQGDPAPFRTDIEDAKKSAPKEHTVKIEANTKPAEKDVDELKKDAERENIKIQIKGESEGVKRDIERLKQPTSSTHTVKGQIVNKEAIDALRRDTSSTHTVYVRTVQTRQNGGEIFDFDGARRFESGGALSGYGGGDIVPALLEPGEFVVRKEAVAKYGSALLHAINSLSLGEVPIAQVRRYATGGLVLGEADSSFIKMLQAVQDTTRDTSASTTVPPSRSEKEPFDPSSLLDGLKDLKNEIAEMVREFLREFKPLRLEFAAPVFTATPPSYAIAKTRLEAEAKLAESLVRSLPSDEVAAKSLAQRQESSLQAEKKRAQEIIDNYKKEERDFRAAVKKQRDAYIARVRARSLFVPAISPLAKGEDDEIQGYIDDAREAYDEEVKKVKDEIRQALAPLSKYGIEPVDTGSTNLSALINRLRTIQMELGMVLKNENLKLLTEDGFAEAFQKETSKPGVQRVQVVGSAFEVMRDRARGGNYVISDPSQTDYNLIKGRLQMQAQGLRTRLQNIARFQTGGRLPGYGGGDIVPALLEPGEFVVRKEAVAHFGDEFLHAINSLRIPVSRYQTGGMVGQPPLPHTAAIPKREVVINIKGERGESMRMFSDDDTARALENYLRRRL